MSATAFCRNSAYFISESNVQLPMIKYFQTTKRLSKGITERRIPRGDRVTTRTVSVSPHWTCTWKERFKILSAQPEWTIFPKSTLSNLVFTLAHCVHHERFIWMVFSTLPICDMDPVSRLLAFSRRLRAISQRPTVATDALLAKTDARYLSRLYLSLSNRVVYNVSLCNGPLGLVLANFSAIHRYGRVVACYDYARAIYLLRYT